MEAIKRALKRLKLFLRPVKKADKVGKLGLWEAGLVMDYGDCYVAQITVNGIPGAVMVRTTTKESAIVRRELIIQTMMQHSRQEASVQLIARTSNGETVNLAKSSQ
jgi:hypothetical protein